MNVWMGDSGVCGFVDVGLRGSRECVTCRGWIWECDEQAGRKHHIDALEYYHMTPVALLCVY